MSSIQAVFSQVLILFLLLMTGFLARRLKVFGAEAIKGMTSLIIKVSLPAMILHSMATQSFTPELLVRSLQVLLASCVVYGVLIGLAVPIGRLLRCPPQDRGVYRFVLVFSNVGFMGFPVVSAVFGQEALFYASIYNLPFNLLAFTVGVVILLRGQDQPVGGKAAFKLEWQHIISPVVVAILAGYAAFLLQPPIPQPVISFLELAGSITTPLSMLVIGGMLAQAPLGAAFGQWRIYVVGAFRLLIWPLAVWFSLRAVFSDPLLAAIPAIITAMPAAANTALLAGEHGANELLASRTIFITTLFSVLTIPLMALVCH